MMMTRNWWAESGHVAVKHDSGCERPSCSICEGGLTICQRCGMAEGSLTTHCPGVESHRDHGDTVYAGEEDFYEGCWVPNRRTVFMYPEDYR